jgi:hypothetical protein
MKFKGNIFKWKGGGSVPYKGANTSFPNQQK